MQIPGFKISLQIAVFAALGAAAVYAQNNTVTGPVAGYVFDGGSRALHVIRGIPGASLIGESVDLEGGITAAWVSPKLDTALTITAAGPLRLYRLKDGAAAPAPIENLPAPERVVFSPSGTSLALVTNGSARIFRGLPDAPQDAGTIALPNARGVAAAAMSVGKLPRPLTGSAPIALSDDGGYLLYAADGTVKVLALAGDARPLTDAATNALVVFAPGGHDAAVIDASTVAFFQDVAGPATVRRYAGIDGAKGAAFSPDRRKLFIAGAHLTAIDTGTGDRTDIACGCTPSALVPMGAVYRLNELSAGPLWLLDVSADPKTVFVPALR
jgi:hypothetical protein